MDSRLKRAVHKDAVKEPRAVAVQNHPTFLERAFMEADLATWLKREGQFLKLPIKEGGRRHGVRISYCELSRSRQVKRPATPDSSNATGLATDHI